MNRLTELAAKLREYADSLDSSSEDLAARIEGPVSFNDAAKALRATLGENQHFEIGVTVGYWKGSKPDVAWQIWEGSTHVKGDTLTDAVNKVLLKHAPKAPSAETPDTVEAQLVELTAK